MACCLTLLSLHQASNCPSGHNHSLAAAGVDQAVFHHVTEPALLMVLVRSLGAAPAESFVFSMTLIPAGTRLALVAGAGATHSLRKTSSAPGAAGSTHWLHAVIIVGGLEPFKMYYAARRALR